MLKGHDIVYHIRNDEFSEKGIGKIPEHILNLIDDSYSEEGLLLENKKKKSMWKLYQRTDFEIPYFLEEDQTGPSDGFCVVYERYDVPRTFFIGNSDNLSNIELVAEELTKNVLEQRELFAFPPKNFTKKGAYNYWALRTIAFTAPTILYGMYDTLINIVPQLEDQESLTDISKYIIIGVIGGAVLGTTNILSISIHLGEVADKYRTRNLPEESLSFSYGFDAHDKILGEHILIKEELKKSNLYNKLENIGFHISKQHFLDIKNAVKLNDISKIFDAIYSREFPSDISLDKVINVFLEGNKK